MADSVTLTSPLPDDLKPYVSDEALAFVARRLAAFREALAATGYGEIMDGRLPEP